MPRRIRELLTLILIVVLPLHALLVTFGTKLIQGPWRPPMTELALWKEGLLAVILALALVELVMERKKETHVDALDLIIALLVLLAFLTPSFNFAFGFKYDFIPLIAFLILRRVRWSEWFRMRAERGLLIIGGLIAAYGIVTFFAPLEFFTALGYSDAHSLYSSGSPLAAFQQISDSSIRRVQSTMSGPNQFGIWLLIPIGISLAQFIRLREQRKENRVWKVIVLCSLFIVLLLALALTFSRSAWIAGFVMLCIASASLIPRKLLVPVLSSALGIFVVVAVAVSLAAPSIFIRRASLIEHINRPLEAIGMMIESPLGFGLGSAGPATHRISEPCVYLDAGADASWAKDNPDLCVFVGDTQVQPVDHDCSCAFLPENWYLQIGVELGVMGLALYLALIGIILWRLKKNHMGFLMFLGISIAALFLHAWEDAAVAYTSWMIVAVVLGAKEISDVRYQASNPRKHR